MSELDLHELDPAAFTAEVHSFEFWFHAVADDLQKRRYGTDPALPEEPLEAEDRERLITVLSNYCVGESIALLGASGLVALAPNHNAKIFLATQAVDEARHLEVFLHRLVQLGVEAPESTIEARASERLLAFKGKLMELIAAKDWHAAIFAQNVILEAMEFTTFRAHAERADVRTRDMLEGVIRDERRHMGFGENTLGSALHRTPELRGRLTALRRVLDSMVLATFEDSVSALGLPADERPQLGRDYLAVVERLGLT
jgi:1,2-phenylacetyl-CoA epoxidase catalytic subunit